MLLRQSEQRVQKCRNTVNEVAVRDSEKTHAVKAKIATGREHKMKLES